MFYTQTPRPGAWEAGGADPDAHAQLRLGSAATGCTNSDHSFGLCERALSSSVEGTVPIPRTRDLDNARGEGSAGHLMPTRSRCCPLLPRILGPSA